MFIKDYIEDLNIHIGSEIQKKVLSKNISRRSIMICFNCSEQKIIRMYNSKHLSTELLLIWCDLLDFNFFKFYCYDLFCSSCQVHDSCNKDIIG